jgi:SAM-dependent methyltransferase
MADVIIYCDGCGTAYDVMDGIGHLVEGHGSPIREQSRWFDREVDTEYEIARPHGAPAFHAWLLSQKFARSIDGLDLTDATVLSVCAGSGMDAEFLARAGARVTAVDISSGAAARTLERGRRFGFDVRAVVADAARLPFLDRSFDVAYVHDGLHHLERPDAALAEMARVSRYAVSVSEPARARITRLAVRLGLALEKEEAGNDVLRLAPDEIGDELRRHGFSVLKAERYAMFYRHVPGRPSRFLSRPGVFQLAKAGYRLANIPFGRFGNKLVVVAVRR